MGHKQTESPIRYPGVWVPLLCFGLIAISVTLMVLLGKTVPPIMWMLAGMVETTLVAAFAVNRGNAKEREFEIARRQDAIEQIADQLGVSQSMIAHALNVDLRQSLTTARLKALQGAKEDQ